MTKVAQENKSLNEKTQVLIVGGGAVGLTAALDLATRGINVIIVEKNIAETPAVPRANHLSARTMEIFRTIGIADKIRKQGLPDDFANDVAFVTTLTGYEIARLPIPSRNERFNSVGYIDSSWPTPEPAHRCNQMYFEPVIRDEAIANPRIKILFQTEITDFTQDEDGVTATGKNIVSGSLVEIRANYMIGCDGARSMVRKKIKSKFIGDDVISRNRMALVKMPDLLKNLAMEPAWMAWFMTPKGHGSVHAIDGKDLWCFHCTLPQGEEDMESLDRDAVIKAAVGLDLPYETIHAEDWYGRRLIASKFSDRRVFLSGDSSHIWIPMAGYGMNAGVADAVNLTWKLAAVLSGWAAPAILDTFTVERRPVTEQVSKHVANIAVVNYAAEIRRNPPVELFEEGEVGEQARASAKGFLLEANMDQFNCAGLNFGPVYDESSIIASDAATPPPFELGSYVPTTIPGCRTPYFTFENGESLYDKMGLGFALLRTDPSLDVSAILGAAKKVGMPMEVVDIEAGAADGVYDHKLVLSRPDQYVAWRGNEVPIDAGALIDQVRGAAA